MVSTKIVSTVPAQAHDVPVYVKNQVNEVLAALRDRREERVTLRMVLEGGRSFEAVIAANAAGLFVLANPKTARGTPLENDIFPAVIREVAAALGAKQVQQFQFRDPNEYSDGTYSASPSFFGGAQPANNGRKTTLAGFNAHVQAAKSQLPVEQAGLLSKISAKHTEAAEQQTRSVFARVGAMLGRGGNARAQEEAGSVVHNDQAPKLGGGH